MYGSTGSDRAWRRMGSSEVMISDYGDVIGRSVSKTKTGYKSFSFKGRTYYVHRVVHELFIGQIPNKFDVNHIDGDNQNNIYKNLEVLSRSENLKHAYKTGLHNGYDKTNDKNPNYKNGKWLDMKHYHRAWARAKYRGLNWNKMSLKEREDLLNTPKRVKGSGK